MFEKFFPVGFLFDFPDYDIICKDTNVHAFTVYIPSGRVLMKMLNSVLLETSTCGSPTYCKMHISRK